MSYKYYTVETPSGVKLARFVMKPTVKKKNTYITPIALEIGNKLPPLKKGETTF